MKELTMTFLNRLMSLLFLKKAKFFFFFSLFLFLFLFLSYKYYFLCKASFFLTIDLGVGCTVI